MNDISEILLSQSFEVILSNNLKNICKENVRIQILDILKGHCFVLKGLKTYLHADAKQGKTLLWPNHFSMFRMSTEAWQRLPIDDVRFRITCCRMFAHSACTTYTLFYTCKLQCRCCFRTRLSNPSQRCSMGFKSGDFDGQGSTRMLLF
jgi:hypothetical protein